MKMDINVKKARSKVDKCIRHLDATMDLFGNEIVSLETVDESRLFWANIVLATQKGRALNQKYSFSSRGERDIFFDRVIEEYRGAR